MLKNKSKALSIVLISVLIVSLGTMLKIETANAHYPAYAYTTYCYVQPNEPVVGVGQQVLLLMWLNAYPPTASGAQGDRWTFYLDVTKPDGTNDTIGPITSDPVGSAFQWYTPTDAGVYTVVSRFIGATLTGVPGQTGNAAVNDTFALHKQNRAFHCAAGPDTFLTKTLHFQTITGLAQYTTLTEAGATL